MQFRRGFKAEVDRLVTQTRADLGLTLDARLDPRQLAAHLDIEVFQLTGLHAICPDEVTHLTQVDVGAFSGTLLERDGRRAIFVNDAHTAGRQASTIAHECAHVMLAHEPSEHFAELGFRVFDAQVEREADWLAGCLLVPTKAVLPAVRCHCHDLAACAVHFGVSEQMMSQRFHRSGAKLILDRARAKQRAGRR